jgi:uncharacterized protein (DUF488 family)
MFYRRKIILALLELFEGQLEKIRLQKLLFLFSQRQENPEYEFIPYRFGCYSYSANADLTVMVKRGMLSESNTAFQKKEKKNYLSVLDEADRKALMEIKSLYGKMGSTALMKHTYVQFPYYAIRSEKAESILTQTELRAVTVNKPRQNDTVLFTIGYEGISLENYLNRLIQYNVKVLVDVRNNPVSMKYGFSGSQLKRYCEALGMQYVHVPEVGIKSEQRQTLDTQSDYNKLFGIYRRTNLNSTKEYQKKILSLLQKHKRIALTCFEANICQCHRKPLAEAIASLPGFKYQTQHI